MAQTTLQTLGKRTLAVLTLCLPGVTGPAVAQEWEQTGEFELGAGYVMDSEYFFGRYTGLSSQKPIAIVNGEVMRRREDAAWQYLEADNLGIDSRHLEGSAGIQGKYGFFFEYDRLPNKLFDTSQTPLNGAGSDNLTLPAGWVRGTTTGTMPQLNSSLHNFDIETERDRYRLGALWRPASRWSTKLVFKHEEKDGTGVQGGAIGNGFGQGAGGVRSTVLPLPIDYKTNQIDATADYARDRGQLRLAYRYSGFDNDNRSLTWQNPFTTGGPGGGGGVSTVGRLALAPDNQLHQVSVSGGYQLLPKTRFSGSLSLGWLKQDDSFLPASANPTATSPPLPRSSLDGEAWITNAFLRLHAQPLAPLRLTGSYRYYDRDLEVDRDNYTQVRLDSQNTGLTLKNRPFDYHKHDFNLDARYRLSPRANLSLRYDFDSLSRSYQNAERDQTDEHGVSAKLKLTPTRKLSGSLYAGTTDRNGSNYNAPPNENPLLRKYNLANRKQDSAGLQISYLPLEGLSLSASTEYRKDDYNNTRIGLTEAEHKLYLLEASYTPLERLTTYMAFTWEDIEYQQSGDDNGTTASGDWRVDLEDRVKTFNIGLEAEAIPDTLRLSADYVFSDGNGKTSPDRAAPYIDFPDVTTKLHSLRLQARYTHSRKLDFRLAYWHERYRSDDWALDNVKPDTVPTVLLTGEDSPNYTNNVIMLSTIYKLGR